MTPPDSTLASAAHPRPNVTRPTGRGSPDNWGKPEHRISDVAQLEALYGPPVAPSLFKELDHIHPLYRPFIEKAPFVALASVGAEGMDCTPRGDHAGFVRVVDEHTVMMPDRRGNNRIDSLRNIMEDPRVALLFLVPGVAEAMRINGRAQISIDPELLDSFAVDGKAPKSVLIVHVDRIYYQCAKALTRSKLWDASTQIPRKALPSTGTIQTAMSKGEIDGEAYDRELPARIQAQLY
jgi:uncharacterized protein